MTLLQQLRKQDTTEYLAIEALECEADRGWLAGYYGNLRRRWRWRRRHRWPANYYAPGDSSHVLSCPPLIHPLPAFFLRVRASILTNSSRLRVSRERREACVRCPVLRPGWLCD